MPANDHLIWLVPEHPLAPAIISSAGVQPWRLKIPIVTFHRDNALLTRREIDATLSGAGNHPSLEKNPEFEKDSITVNTTWYKAWKGLLEESREVISQEGKGRGVREEDNIGMLSYGAHWNWGELGGELTNEELMEGYRRSVSRLKGFNVVVVRWDLGLDVGLDWELVLLLGGHVDREFGSAGAVGCQDVYTSYIAWPCRLRDLQRW